MFEPDAELTALAGDALVKGAAAVIIAVIALLKVGAE